MVAHELLPAGLEGASLGFVEHLLARHPALTDVGVHPAREIAQKPGGWSNARYNLEMGPPLLAPLLVTMVGGMGLLAAILRREK